MWKKLKFLEYFGINYALNFKIWREKNDPPPDHNLGQILNSDPARSYFPFNTPTCT